MCKVGRVFSKLIFKEFVVGVAFFFVLKLTLEIEYKQKKII